MIIPTKTQKPTFGVKIVEKPAWMIPKTKTKRKRKTNTKSANTMSQKLNEAKEINNINKDVNISTANEVMK